jgi:hypothetical protein
MGEAKYPHRLDKLAISMMSAMNAKEQAVKKYGIGEEIPLSIICWSGDKISLVLSASWEVQKSAPSDRFGKVNDALCIARKGWGIDAFTLIAEGFCSTDPSVTDGMDLREAFIKPGMPVSECIAITHTEPEEVTFIAKPFSLTYPKRVVWEEELYFPGQTRIRGQDSMYPRLMSKVLTDVEYELPPVDENAYYEELSEGLAEHGFACQWL